MHFGGYKPKAGVFKDNGDPHQQILVDAQEWEPTIRHTDVDLTGFPEGIWVRPGVGILCSTVEVIDMPANWVGQVLLKSSRGREFYQSCIAGFVDNGFKGELTLEIYAPVVPIKLVAGMKIVQLRIDQMQVGTYDITYKTQANAKYLDQVGPTASRCEAYQ